MQRARGTPGNKGPENTRAGFRGDSVKLRWGNGGVKKAPGVLPGVVFPGDNSCSVKRAEESFPVEIDVKFYKLLFCVVAMHEYTCTCTFPMFFKLFIHGMRVVL